MGIENLKDRFLIDRLINEAAKNKESASYLFYGDKRVNLLFYALEFSKIFLCEEIENDYCDICPVCKSIDNFSYPDIEILNKDNTGVKIEDIRDIIYRAAESPYKSKKKVYILNGLEKLRKESANALLKTIEEPPKNLYFILLTTSLNIIPTIKSRVMKFYIKPLDFDSLEVEKKVYDFFDGNIDDIKLWKNNPRSTDYEKIELEMIVKNIEIYYTFKEFSDLLLRVQNEKVFSEKKEFMNKADFKMLKDNLKDLQVIHEDKEGLFDVEKLKNNETFSNEIEGIKKYSENIYLELKMNYIFSINALGKNYKYYRNSEKIEVTSKIFEIFSSNKKDIKDFFNKLILIRKNKIKNLNKIVEIKNSIDNNVSLKAIVSNFFMFYE